ncbi:MAG: BamA/TamA family outer membrane protein [Candidatus Kapaibacteriota bacterium]
MQKIFSTIRFILFFCCFSALCQTLSKGAETRRFALKTIRIYGNAHLSSQQILNALNITLPTELELNHNLDWNDVFTPELFKRYYPEGKSGKIRVALDSVTLKNRVEILENLYQRKGYFDADIQLNIDIDSLGLGILDVICKEGRQYALTDLLLTDTLLVNTIPWNTIQEDFRFRLPRFYDEDSLNAMLNASFQKLLERGYAFLEYRIEQILIDTVKKNVVSIIHMLNPERYKINSISFEHNNVEGDILKDDLLQQLLFIKPQDWLSPQAVNRSKNQLIGLSFFSEVSESKKKIITSTDTVANVSYLLKYKKPEEVVFSVFLNRTTMDNFLNMGLEASYSDLLVSSTGNSFSIFSRLLAQDISNTVFSTQRGLEFEYSIGTNFNQPFAFFLGEHRVPLTYSAQISLRNLPTGLKLLTPLLRVSNFNTFPEWTLFSNLNFDATLDFTRLLNFNIDATDPNDPLYRLIAPYTSLTEYYKDSPFSPASFTLGLTLTGDRRNSVITPSSGYFLTLPQIEYSPDVGYSHFFRVFTQFHTFTPVKKNLVFATKIRLGHIVNWGFSDEDKSTPPFEKHFFAGGANSVRAWPSRGLRDQASSIEDSLASRISQLSAIIGSASLVEGSIELRYSFPKPKGIAEFWADKIARSGLVLFFDWGNSFNRLTPKTYNLANFERIINPANWGYGYGLGFRFDTPAGPFRLDMAFPFYDPNSASYRIPEFSSAQFHIGLGHAF